MDLVGAPAETVGHHRRDVVDVGIVLALDASRRRNDFDIEAALRLQSSHDGADALAAGDANRIAIRNLFEQQPGCRLTDGLKRRLRIVRYRRHDHGAADAAERPKLLFHIHQRLDRRLDLDLDPNQAGGRA